MSVSSNMLTLHQSHRSCIISSQAVLVQFPNFLQFSPRSSNTLHVTPIIPSHHNHQGRPTQPGRARDRQHCEKLTSLSSAAGARPEEAQQEQSSHIYCLSHAWIVLTPIRDASFQNHNGKSFRSEELLLAGVGLEPFTD